MSSELAPHQLNLRGTTLETHWINTNGVFDLANTIQSDIKELLTPHKEDSPEISLVKKVLLQNEQLKSELRIRRKQEILNHKVRGIVKHINECSNISNLFTYIIESVPTILWLQQYEYHFINTATHCDKDPLSSPTELFYALLSGYKDQRNIEHMHFHTEDKPKKNAEQISFPLILRNYSRPKLELNWEEVVIWHLCITQNKQTFPINKKDIANAIGMVMEAIGNYVSHLQTNELIGLLRKITTTDFLTGVANRMHFFDEGKKMKQSIPEWEYFVTMLLDIDNFKSINDEYGHNMGDTALKIIANISREYLGDHIFARFGWEEFTAIYYANSQEDAVEKAEILRERIAEVKIPVSEWKDISITVSIGIIASQNNLADLDQMLTGADVAMYTAKWDGKNKVVSSGIFDSNHQYKKRGNYIRKR